MITGNSHVEATAIGETIRRGMIARRILDAGVDISPVITHRYPYQEFEKGFEAVRSGNSGKVILDFEEM